MDGDIKMQYIINQNTWFLEITYKLDFSSSKINYDQKKIKDRLETICKYKFDFDKSGLETSYYMMFLTNIYQRIDTWKTLGGKQKFMKANNGLICKIEWMGSITVIDEAVIRMHEIMKKLKNDIEIIDEIKIYFGGVDYEYNDIKETQLVKNDINKEVK